MVHRFLFGTEKEEEQLDKHLVYYSDFTTYWHDVSLRFASYT